MNRQRLSGTFFAACKVFSNHERDLKNDGVIELTQVETGQLFDLLEAVHQRIAVYEQLARGLRTTFRLFSKNFWMVNRVSWSSESIEPFLNTSDRNIHTA